MKTVFLFYRLSTRNNNHLKKKKKRYECTLGRFDAIEIGEPELKKINEFKAIVGEPRFIAGCY